MFSDVFLSRERSGSPVALQQAVIRPTVAGWQLPYLRVALILRRLQVDRDRGVNGRRQLAARELANVVRIGDAVRRAGWFN